MAAKVGYATEAAFFAAFKRHTGVAPGAYHRSGAKWRVGSADLPPHGGRVPPWLAARMAALGRVVVEAVVHHYGRDELLRRLAHPLWSSP